MSIPQFPRYTLIRSIDFLKELDRAANSAKHIFYAESMFTEPGQFSKKLENIFIKLRGKNIDCSLNIDYFGLMFDEGRVHYLNKYFSSSNKHREKLEFYRKLKSIGVRVNFLNKPTFFERIFPYAGRNHAKIVIVDDTSYVGGMNFSDKDLTNEDFMLRIENKQITQKLVQIYNSFQTEEFMDDKKFIIDNETDLLVDSGTINRSMILKEAVKLVQNSKKSIVFLNQFLPNGDLLKNFKMAKKRGVEVNLIMPLENKFNLAFSFIYNFNKNINNLREFNLRLFSGGFHSKVLIIDGETVIFGSHNLAKEGVLIGTTELAIKSSDKSIVDVFNNYYEDLRKKL